ncbi:MAG TPA: hypothetical protein VJJ26_01010 [Candidatus Babeliales bacterium]|nr:hypothetical protein [Candidatus Babeliales bacterium]
MKKVLLFFIVGVTFFTNMDLICFGDKTVFGIRSQGLNGVRELAGWQQIIYKYDQDSNYGTIAATVEYARSIRPHQISEFLFGSECLHFSGSRADRKEGDILADYFGLPASFSSTVIFSPHISNVIVDFNWFQAFDAYLPGLFIMVHLPIVQTKWNLYAREVNIDPGTAFYPAGYMSDINIPASSLPQSVTEALRGNTTFGDMQDPLQYGKVFGRQTRSRIAELTATLGWNYNQPRYHVGLNFRVGAPTGNATNAEFIFEDIVGNRHHWDVGGGVSAHGIMWQNKEKGKRLGLYFDAHVSHLCTSQQKRSFDFTKNGNGSRYILLEQIESPAQDLLINGSAPTNQYIGNLFPAINYTTFDTHISIGVQTDIVLKLAYQKDGFELDLGYNFWANSKEKLHCRDTFIENRFALKGDAQIYGFTADNSAIALNATQSEATILKGQDNGNGNFANLNADNQPALASTAAGILNQLNATDSAALAIPQVQVRGSNPAILLSDNDINNESGILPRALSNKIFGYVGCIWDNRDDIDPYLGIGLSGEFANTNPCNNAMCSQWAIWVKGGLSY